MEYSGKFGVHFKMRAERAKDGKAPVFMGIVINAEKIYVAPLFYFMKAPM